MNYNNNAPTQDEALCWDSQISGEVKEFTLLEPGEYDFTVTKYERAYSNGKDGQKPCPIVKLTLDFEDTVIKTDLFWTLKCQWKITQFMICIGMQQPGVPTTMNWNMLVGSRGRAKVIVNTWKDNSGNERQNNRVDRFLPPDPNSDGPNPFTQPQQQYTQPAQQTYQQPAQPAYQPQQTTMPGYQQNPNQYGGWKPGNF